MLRFLYYYLRSMRLYYGFVTATTVLAGICIAPGTVSLVSPRCIAMLAFGFLAWGANQIFSDWCDRKEDAINAPHRPMVTGKLAPRPAFALSGAILAAIGAGSAFISLWTLPFLLAGGALNIAYSHLKRVPVLNCMVYAAAISCCALYAIAGTAGRLPDSGEFAFVALTNLPAHFLMCHNSYYKDVPGDKAAGVRTLQTMCEPRIAQAVTSGGAALAACMSLLVVYWLGDDMGNSAWRFCQPIAAAVLAASHFIAIRRHRYQAATFLNCQLCVVLLHTCFFDITWPLEIASLATIQLLYLWYDDEQE